MIAPGPASHDVDMRRRRQDARRQGIGRDHRWLKAVRGRQELHLLDHGVESMCRPGLARGAERRNPADHVEEGVGQRRGFGMAMVGGAAGRAEGEYDSRAMSWRILHFPKIARGIEKLRAASSEGGR